MYPRPTCNFRFFLAALRDMNGRTIAKSLSLVGKVFYTVHGAQTAGRNGFFPSPTPPLPRFLPNFQAATSILRSVSASVDIAADARTKTPNRIHRALILIFPSSFAPLARALLVVRQSLWTIVRKSSGSSVGRILLPRGNKQPSTIRISLQPFIPPPIFDTRLPFGSWCRLRARASLRLVAWESNHNRNNNVRHHGEPPPLASDANANASWSARSRARPCPSAVLFLVAPDVAATDRGGMDPAR